MKLRRRPAPVPGERDSLTQNNKENTVSEETTSEAPVEVSEATKQNIENVHRLNQLLTENVDNDSLETFDKIITLLDDVKVRDGLLNIFANSSWQERNAFTDKATTYLHTIGSREDALQIPKVKIGNFTSFVAALTYIHLGANYHEGHDNPALPTIVDALLKSAEDFETDWTFFVLMKRARQFNVPNHILYDSVVALSFDECVVA